MVKQTMESDAPSSSFTILLFGDYTDPWIDSIDQAHQEAISTPWLQRFLDNVASIIRTETEKMDSVLRKSLAGRSLRDTVETYRHVKDDLGLVDAVMVYISKAVALLQWVKQNPEALRSRRPETLGISGGLFNASVLAVAHDFESLYEACLVVTGLVCRHCGLAWTRSRDVEESTCSWGWALVGISADELETRLDKFQQTIGVPAYKRAAIGVRGDGWNTVIGPPSVLDLCLNQCPALRNLAKKELSIHTLQHNPNCKWSPADLDYVVGTSHLHTAPLVPGFRLWGLEDAHVGDASSRYATWANFLRDVVYHAFSKPVDMVDHVYKLKSSILSCRAPRVQVGVMGPTYHEAYFMAVLKATGRQVVMTQDTPSDLSPKWKQTHPDSFGANRIAVVGMGGRGPDSDSSDGLDQFWEVIKKGQDVAREIPEGRFNADGLFSPPPLTGEKDQSPCKSTTKFGCFLKNPGHFDAKFFHLSPREATLLDPCSRLYQTAVYEAVEMAGYNGRIVDPKRIGVFYGQTNEDGYTTAHREKGCDAYTLQTVQRAFAPGRAAFHFGWEGPTWSLDCACSTSISLLHLAAQALRAHDIDMAVVGASNVISNPHGWCALSKSGVLSDSGNCKPFRDDADGYCRGEFVGAVVLRRLEDAVVGNDEILAVIAGSGRNHSGNATSITAPDGRAQERLCRELLRDAGVAPADVSYVEMHGTGIPVGDPCEMAAVANVLGSGLRDEPLTVGAVKANIGHSEAASGVASLIKCIYMFREQVMPPQAGMPHALNPNFPPLDELNIRILSETGQFRSGPGKTRRILLNNFDAAGGNACLLLEDPTPITTARTNRKEQRPDPRSAHIVVTSAKTQSSHQANNQRLLHWLRANPTARLQDIAYTTTARRIHHPLRFACSASSTQDLIAALESDCLEQPDSRSAKAVTPPPSIVFVFTGQGSEYIGMGDELYRTSPEFRKTVDSCARICADFGFHPFLDIITGDDCVDLKRMSAVQTQLAVVTLEIALAAFWRATGVEPVMVVGHSLGEYAALHVAGVLSLADTLYLVGQRALLLVKMCEVGVGGMLAVSASADTVQSYIDRLKVSHHSSCGIACINSPNATVVSGTADDVAELQAALAAENISSKRLSVSYGFHSFQIEPILRDFASLASGVKYSQPKIPLASTLLASVIDTPGIINQVYLQQQTRQPVDFVGAVQAAKSKLDDPIWLEIGPRRVCSSFVRAIPSSSPPWKVMSTLETATSNWASVFKCMATMYKCGIDIDWLWLHAPYESSLKLLRLPSYAWDVKDYWITWNERRAGTGISNAPGPANKKPYYYTCAQHVVQKSSSPTFQVTFRAVLDSPELKTIIGGHCMRDAAVCPGSVYGDAALAATMYLLEYSGRQDFSSLDLALRNMNLTRPLTQSLVGPDGELHTVATLESDSFVSVSFKAWSLGSNTSYDIGTCDVMVQDTATLQSSWDRASYFIKARMDAITKDVKDGRGHRLQPAIFYPLFNNTIEYRCDDYKCIQEAYVSQDFQEATAEVVLSNEPPGTRFIVSPYWGEGLVHLAGFLVNCNPSRHNGGTTTFVMDSVESIERTAALEAGKPYFTYARVCKTGDALASCDVIVFDEAGKIVLQCLDLRYHEVRNSVLETLRIRPMTGTPSSSNSIEPGQSRLGPRDVTRSHAKRTSEPGRLKAATGAQAKETPNNGVLQIILQTIAKETGSDVSELTDDTSLAELGVDSIMAIEIVARVKGESEFSLSPTFVMECPTIRHLRGMLGLSESQSQAEEEEEDSSSAGSEHLVDTAPSPTCYSSSSFESVSFCAPSDPSTSLHSFHEPQSEQHNPNPAPSPKNDDDTSPPPKARIVLLRPHPKPTQPHLYLIADGFGSVSCYIHLLSHKFPLPIYGIDSPYLRCPTRLTPQVGIEGVAKLMVEALTEFQPQGPLILGGFSGGATLAYEMCRQLAAAGREVQGLLIIDMRCPLPPPDAVVRTSCDRVVPRDVVENLSHHAFAAESLGYNPDSETAMHLGRLLAAVSEYHPASLGGGGDLGFRTAIIWCEKGMLDRLRRDENLMRRVVEYRLPLEAYPGFMEDPKLGHVLWSILHKTEADLGPNGWERFVNGGEGGRDIFCQSIKADHGEIMQPPFARQTHRAMGRALVFLLGYATT